MRLYDSSQPFSKYLTLRFWINGKSQGRVEEHNFLHALYIMLHDNNDGVNLWEGNTKGVDWFNDPADRGEGSSWYLATKKFLGIDANSREISGGVAGHTGITCSVANIADHPTSPTTANDTDFGSVSVGSSVTRTYSIKNTGAGYLTLRLLKITGRHATDFTVIREPYIDGADRTRMVLLGGESTTFQVKFEPSATGTRTATVSFASYHRGLCDDEGDL